MRSPADAAATGDWGQGSTTSQETAATNYSRDRRRGRGHRSRRRLGRGRYREDGRGEGPGEREDRGEGEATESNKPERSTKIFLTKTDKIDAMQNATKVLCKFQP